MGTKQQAAATAIATRDRKQYGIETGSWREEVRARAAEHGLDRASRRGDPRAPVVARRARPGRRARSTSGRSAIISPAPTGLTERSNTFTEREVLRELAERAPAGRPRRRDVREQAARFVDRADVLETASGELTSAELVACERRLIAAATGRAAAVPRARGRANA